MMRMGVKIGVAVFLARSLMVIAGDMSTDATDHDFGPLAGLVGTWESQVDMNEDGKPEPMTVTYRITGGGSALVETMNPGSDHEMVTVYTRDGDHFTLTHYCMAGNQPRMRAAAGTPGKLSFDFVDATGMSSPNESHMHSLVLEFVDANHLRQTWSFYENGAKQHDSIFDLTRKQ